VRKESCSRRKYKSASKRMNYEGPVFLLQLGTKYHRKHAIARMIPSQSQLQSATDTRRDCFDRPCEKSPCWCPGSRVYPREEWRWTGTAGLRSCLYRITYIACALSLYALSVPDWLSGLIRIVEIHQPSPSWKLRPLKQL